MKITNEMRNTKIYQYWFGLFKDGWYVRQENYIDGTNTYCFTKDRPDKTRRVKYYFARDVALAFSKEFGVKIRKARRQSVALNFNPKNYVPAPGHKLSFHEH